MQRTGAASLAQTMPDSARLDLGPSQGHKITLACMFDNLRCQKISSPPASPWLGKVRTASLAGILQGSVVMVAANFLLACDVLVPLERDFVPNRAMAWCATSYFGLIPACTGSM